MSSENILTATFIACRENLSRAVSRFVPPKEIEDIVQETYVRMCQVNSDEIRHPRAFLMRTARNLALDHLKRAETRLVDSMEGDEHTNTGQHTGGFEVLADETFEKVASSEEFSRFCDAVRQLPLQCRRVFVLKKVYGHSQKEIAKELSISESTVEKHIATGIKRCSYFMMARTDSASLKINDKSPKSKASVSSLETRRASSK
ncbi:MAG: RNA polymerase sigma factor [Cellvibrionaceae bacterium]